MPHRQRCIQHSYTYFRLAGRMPGIPRPYFIGHYGARNPSWKSNSDFVWGSNGYFACCLAGRGVVNAGEKQRPFMPGTAYLCRWDNPRAWHVARGDDELRWVFMVFQGKSALQSLDAILDRYGPFYTLDTHSTLICRLLTVSRQPAHDTRLLASEGASLVWDVLRELMLCYEREWDLQLHVDVAEQAARIVRQRDLAKLSVASIARLLGISREHLARVFSGRYGQSLQDYLTEYKLREACVLLRQTGTPVKQIAAKLGYATLPAFHRAFRRLVGGTPGEYRRGGNQPHPDRLTSRATRGHRRVPSRP